MLEADWFYFFQDATTGGEGGQRQQTKPPSEGKLTPPVQRAIRDASRQVSFGSLSPV